ncbi:25595_t:CDS:1, partial [Gigaspora rosea]
SGGVTCDDEQYGASVVFDRVIIPSSSQHLDLVGKALCRKHYNKLIVNAKRSKANYVCSYPKHQVYTSTARTGTETNAFLKVLERLLNFFVLQQGAMICHHCLYKTDDDPEYVNLPDYLLPPERISKKDIRKFQGRSYVLRDDVIYSQSEFQELESMYYE